MIQSMETVEMLQAILTSIDEGIHAVNGDGITIYYNPVIAKLDGLDEGEVVGKHILDVFPSLNTHTSTLLQVIKTGVPIIDQPQTYTNIKGKQVDTVNTTLPIRVSGKIVGAVEVAKDISKVKLLSEKLLELQEQMSRTQGKTVKRSKQSASSTSYGVDDLISQDDRMHQIKQTIQRISKTDSPVMVYGETGTGKEIIVQSLHAASARSNAPFIAQNCAALPASLLESLLFGTTKGSFTGSVDRAGLFQLADGGTLFLDEINSMPIELQAKLLRVLQDGVIRRIGDSKTYPINVRIVAALNEDPLIAVREGRLRSDLYYRIHVVSLFLPPLRDRKEDIPLLVQHFLQQFDHRFGRSETHLEEQTLKKMLHYHWPGNVRELEHALEAAMNMTEESILREEHFPASLRSGWTLSEERGIEASTVNGKERSWDKQTLLKQHLSLPDLLQEEERYWIAQALQETKGNIKQAAELLQIPRQTLQYRIKKLQIRDA